MREPALVAEHYAAEGLGARVVAALGRAGLDRGRLRWDQLSGLDQFHAGGLAMTRRLASGLGLEPSHRVLDVGAGLGGPARCLAATYGCQVTGIDLTPAFVDVAALLSERTGQVSKTTFRQGDATALPFADASFDRALSQHAAMNIADRAALYAELYRVLRPGGLLAIHDITQGSAGAVRYPVPWAQGPESSFLLTPQQTRSALARAGFAECSFVDVSEETVQLGLAPPAGGRDPARLRLDVVMGDRFAAMSENLRRNLAEGRTRAVQIIACRDAA